MTDSSSYITRLCCIAMILVATACSRSPFVPTDNTATQAPIPTSTVESLEHLDRENSPQRSRQSSTRSVEKDSAIVQKQRKKRIARKPQSSKLPAPEEPKLEKPTSVESLAIVLSEGNPRDQTIADEIRQQMGIPTQLFYLNEMLPQQRVIDVVQASSYEYVVVIGATAANRAKALSDKRVIFAQVFNYQADGLLGAGFSGVSMIPSTQALISQWKKVYPPLTRLAVVTGPDNDHQVATMIAQAARHRVTLEHYIVNNDKEMLYVAKQVAANVQGFWLLPDNRVLSRRGVKEFMSYTMKHNKQVAVFNRNLLKFGGLFYVTVDANYVAKRVIRAVTSRPATVLDLEKAKIEINNNTIKRLKLNAS